MTDTQTYVPEAGQPYEASFGDYVALLKPRVMSLVVFTALVAFWWRRCLCTRLLDWRPLFLSHWVLALLAL